MLLDSADYLCQTYIFNMIVLALKPIYNVKSYFVVPGYTCIHSSSYNKVCLTWSFVSMQWKFHVTDRQTDRREHVYSLL